MASDELQTAPNRRRRRRFQFFTSCFERLKSDEMKVSEKRIGSSKKIKKKKKKISPFSCFTFRMKTSGTKTVPVDAEIIAEKVCDQVAAAGSELEIIPELVPVTDRLIDLDKPRKATNTFSKPRDTPQKFPETSKNSNINTCRSLSSLCRSKTESKKGGTHTSFLEKKPSRCTTFPQSDGRKLAKSGGVPRKGKTRSGEKLNRESRHVAGKFDPAGGMSTLIVALAILLVWGRICAIFTTAAWFYLLPRVRPRVESGENAGKPEDSGSPDVNSDEYKKRVVMEGLLERRTRKPVGSV